MNKVEIMTESGEAPLWEPRCRRFIENVLEYRQINGWEVSILFCGNDMIHSLNKQYRDRDEPTDVLSFCQLEGEVPDRDGLIAAGDIVISMEYISQHAGEYNVTEDNELKRLLIHGILHLEGLDHSGTEPDQEMLVLQEKILEKIEGENIL